MGPHLFCLVTDVFKGNKHCHSARTLFSASIMRSNAWTTQDEFDYLTPCIPRFVEQQGLRIVSPFLIEVAKAFLAKFPSRATEFTCEELVKVRLISSPLFMTLTPSRKSVHGSATILVTSQRGMMLEAFLTSVGSPTATPFLSNNPKHTLPCITSKGPRCKWKFLTCISSIRTATLQLYPASSHCSITPLPTPLHRMAKSAARRSPRRGVQGFFLMFTSNKPSFVKS